jgi:MFS family permease
VYVAPPVPTPAGLKTAFYLTMAVAVVGFAFVNPSVSASISRRVDSARQGEVMGVNQSFASLGRILGPFLGSVLFQMGASHTLPYLAAVGLLVVVGLLLPRVKGDQRFTAEGAENAERNRSS